MELRPHHLTLLEVIVHLSEETDKDRVIPLKAYAIGLALCPCSCHTSHRLLTPDGVVAHIEECEPADEMNAVDGTFNLLILTVTVTAPLSQTVQVSEHMAPRVRALLEHNLAEFAWFLPAGVEMVVTD